MKLLETYDGYYYNIEQIVKVKVCGIYLKVYMNDGKCFYRYCSLADFLERIGGSLCD